MNKKMIQSFIILAMLVGMFATTGAAFAASSCGTSVTVVSGDTLRKIANRCDTTVSALRRANPEVGNGNLIYPGQVLLLPGTILGTDGGYVIYIVSRGDTVRSLATRFGSSIDSILASNPSITNVNLIYEGQRLTIYAVAPGNTPPPPPPPAGQTYYVQSGDTLRRIASKFSTSVDVLLSLNPQIFNPNVIFVGQALTVPADAATYVVQSGDTLRKIANRFGTTVDNLLYLNPNISNANIIYVGQVINVR